MLPYMHQKQLCSYPLATSTTLKTAIKNALKVKPEWEAMPFNDRAAIFLKAADLLSTKYRYKVMAATMLGQGKNAWQAEIDAAAELADFWRFNAMYAAEMYAQQPQENASLTWNRMEYRPLEGFVTAFTPFNFTAIGGNLPSAPAIMGLFSSYGQKTRKLTLSHRKCCHLEAIAHVHVLQLLGHGDSS